MASRRRGVCAITREKNAPGKGDESPSVSPVVTVRPNRVLAVYFRDIFVAMSPHGNEHLQLGPAHRRPHPMPALRACALQISSVFSWGYMASMVPSSVMIGVWGPKATITAGKKEQSGGQQRHSSFCFLPAVAKKRCSSNGLAGSV